MFPNEYEVLAHRQDLLRQAQQHQLARALAPKASFAQQTGQHLLKLGARLTATADVNECLTVETSGHVVTVCPA